MITSLHASCMHICHHVGYLLSPATTRPTTENTQYQQYDWLISHIAESIKKSESDAKQNIINLFVSKINNTPMDYKPKKTIDAFYGKSKKDKKLSLL